MRDQQRTRCYHWEWSLWEEDLPPLSASTAAELFVFLCEQFRISKPATISIEPEHKYAYQLGYNVFIPTDQAHMHIVLHEFAHLVTYDLYEQHLEYDYPAHGVDWLTIYMILLAKYCQIPVDRLTQTADAAKLKYDRNKVEKYGNSQAG